MHGNALPDSTSPAGINALDITPYADNTPLGWGIETYWNQGNPVPDGGLQNTGADLLIFNGVSGISDNIEIQPSASMAEMTDRTAKPVDSTTARIISGLR